ncbi:MAG TPA: APC family permease [Trueperaceae bacterium]
MASPQVLKRELGLFGAVMLGLGSIVGTGVFVSIGVAAGITGPSVVLAVAIGALVATFNGLSSAQLAANHPVSGGTYEYGYEYLTPVLGFVAGWMFLSAKSASAATAALGFAGYLTTLLGLRAPLVPIALAALAVLVLVVLGGMRRSNATNIAIVSITLLALVFFVIAGMPLAAQQGGSNFTPFFRPAEGSGGLRALLYAAALMFVAYTGYGRIATLGEEVKEPRRTIPRAIIVALVATMLLYASVALVGVGAVGAGTLGRAAGTRAAPLAVAAGAFALPFAPHVLAVGAITAMLGVLLNLILGLSRVLLAMGRRRDMPPAVARLDAAGSTPTVAVVVMGLVIAALVLIGNVKSTWSFSAFTVLVYYALTNLSALFLPPDGRLFPRWISVAGLLSCLFLAFFVQRLVWLAGLGLIAAGLLWFLVAQRLKGVGR